MNLGMTFIYLACSTGALIIFDLFFFIGSMFMLGYFDSNKAKTVALEQNSSKAKSSSMNHIYDDRSTRVENSGLKIYLGD